MEKEVFETIKNNVAEMFSCVISTPQRKDTAGVSPISIIKVAWLDKKLVLLAHSSMYITMCIYLCSNT